ncbi:glycoside hydrolase family 2 protein [Phocaeicola sp.]
MRHSILLFLLAFVWTSQSVAATNTRDKYNFNSDWLLHVGDTPEAKEIHFQDTDWKKVTLPRPFNEDEAFRLSIEQLTDTVMWYRKHFRLPADSKNKKVFIEFEGVRQGADFYINGKYIGLHENGAMAVGFDLTPYIKYGQENVMAVRIDNDWNYKERSTNTKYQWSDRNFNANYGGIPKNVWLHVTDKLYQTLPLYSNLKTTGVYIYAEDIRVKSRKAIINAESEIKNEYNRDKNVAYKVELIDRDGKTIKTFDGTQALLKPGETTTLKASAEVDGLHFWSWGYGYLYTVKTSLWVDGKKVDEVATRTGFRKARFGKGMIWLNDRVLQMKGFAQRTSNEWPGVGMSVPAWLSDYSNGLMVEDNANLVRWMHITPWKQDIESCDRVGLIQAMQAGDAEKDREGRQWGQRTELMRDAIIYNRNNPSILFYECGNESISREHMIEMKAIRDQYDPHGGRAIGSREMLDIREAEYGGEMLYINKSKHHPMWAMEYCRDEGLRKYWDEYSYPYHKNGEGNNSFRSAMTNKVQKKVDARAYNHNQDSFTIENVIRWFDYWRERPGTGDRVSSGGVKIIFSDTNTHYRGVENYRRSGVTDAMRIPKDPFFAHQVMWDGWVDIENPRIHIVGHWNYKEGTVKPVYVVSSAERVELFLNGKSLGNGERNYNFLFTFKEVAFAPGNLEAVGYDENGKECCRTRLLTAGEPQQIKLSAIQNPDGWKADGADMVLLQVEVTDKDGNRCPLANDLIHFEVEGPAEWRGGIAQGKDNFILSKDLPVECGINRALIRSLTTAGTVRVTAKADGLQPAEISFSSLPIEVKDGLSKYIPGNNLEGRLTRGETPLTPSYKDTKVDVNILSAVAGANNEDAAKSFDDNELSEWKNDGRAGTAWITYHLERAARVDEVCVKLTGWRLRSYPLEIYAGDELIWSGETDKSLGYVHLKVKPVLTNEITIRLKGASKEGDAFGQIVEVAAPAAGELDLFKAKDGDKINHELRIVEIEFKENLWQ